MTITSEISLKPSFLEIPKPPVLSGMDYTFAFTGLGNVKVAEDTQKIQNNMVTILLTRKGEIFGKPEFGSLLQNSIYAPADALYKERISREITKTLAEFVPQVTVQGTKVVVSDTVITITIRYEINILGVGTQELILDFDIEEF